MEQYIEFAGNNPLLVGGFFAVLVALVVTEVLRKMKGVSELTPAQAVAWINDPNTVVVDISPAAEFNKGHIVDAKHIQAKRLSDPDAEMQKLQDKRVLLVCKSGQAAMSSASQIRSLGVQDVAVLKGGMAQWRQDQFPVTTS